MFFRKISEKSILVLIFLFMMLIPAQVDADEKNINRLLNNQAVVSRQIMCILEKSPCDQLGKQLKGILLLLLVHIIVFFSGS